MQLNAALNLNCNCFAMRFRLMSPWCVWMENRNQFILHNTCKNLTFCNVLMNATVSFFIICENNYFLRFTHHVELNDTDGYVVIGGSQYANGIKGYYGPMVYYRNQIPPLTTVRGLELSVQRSMIHVHLNIT